MLMQRTKGMPCEVFEKLFLYWPENRYLALGKLETVTLLAGPSGPPYLGRCFEMYMGRRHVI